MGEMALRLGRFREAAEAYLKEIKMHEEGGNLSGQMIAHLNLGRAYRLSGNRNEEAQKEFKVASALSAKLADDAIFTTISTEMGLTHLAANEFEKAADIFANNAEILEIDGKERQSVEARIYLARVLNAQGKKAEALQELDQAEKQLDDAGFDLTNPEDVRLKNDITILRTNLT
jgi:tetratricopeptide (TPR) repeat protein